MVATVPRRYIVRVKREVSGLPNALTIGQCNFLQQRASSMMHLETHAYNSGYANLRGRQLNPVCPSPQL